MTTDPFSHEIIDGDLRIGRWTTCQWFHPNMKVQTQSVLRYVFKSFLDCSDIWLTSKNDNIMIKLRLSSIFNDLTYRKDSNSIKLLGYLLTNVPRVRRYTSYSWTVTLWPRSWDYTSWELGAGLTELTTTAGGDSTIGECSLTVMTLASNSGIEWVFVGILVVKCRLLHFDRVKFITWRFS